MSNDASTRALSVERTHTGVLLRALYPLGLDQLPLGVRRSVRRATTSAAVHAWLARCQGVQIAAITGSMGKTTTKDMLAAMLASAGPTVRTRQNDNGLYGVPASLLSIRPDDRFAVIEAGIEDTPGEMAWMASLFRPRVAILTGVGFDHVGAYGTRAAIAREKRALLDRATHAVVVNADDELARRAAVGLPVVTAGRAPDADVRLVESRLRWPHGTEIRVAAGGDEATALVRLHGEHLAPLMALAAAAARELGVPLGAALDAAADVATPAGRLEAAPGPNGTTWLLDHFKSRPANAAAAARTLAAVPGARRVAVIGEMQAEDAGGGDPWAPVADALADVEVVIVVGDSGLAQALERRGFAGRLLRTTRVEDTAETLAAVSEAGDVVLLHASTHQHLVRVRLLLEGADVRCRVRRCKLHWFCTDCPWLTAGPPPGVVKAW